jgi:hypothetical protein
MGMSRSEAWRLWEASRKAIKPVPFRMHVAPVMVPPLVPPVLMLALVAAEARLHSDGC